MKNEDGINSGVRNLGRLFLAAIPLALGLGAVTWFGLWITGHNFRNQVKTEKHELSQQERSAVYVGAGVRPKDKLTVEIVPRTCFKIVRADLDTKRGRYGTVIYSLILYGRNDCHAELDYVAYHWQAISPNGVVLKKGYKNTGNCPAPSIEEIAECPFEINLDDRIDKFMVWGQTDL